MTKARIQRTKKYREIVQEEILVAANLETAVTQLYLSPPHLPPPHHTHTQASERARAPVSPRRKTNFVTTPSPPTSTELVYEN